MQLPLLTLLYLALQIAHPFLIPEMIPKSNNDNANQKSAERQSNCQCNSLPIRTASSAEFIAVVITLNDAF